MKTKLDINSTKLISLKKFIPFLLILILTSCAVANYRLVNNAEEVSLDFSKGKWLLGNIESNTYVKNDLTELAIKKFSGYLGDRFEYSGKLKSILLPLKIPFNPSKTNILDLKKGTDFDYFINIKSKNAKNNLENFDFTEHNYYKVKMSYGVVQMEIYDLNQGKIIFSQYVVGSLNEDSGLTYRPIHDVVIGCFNKITNKLEAKSFIKQ